jgi:hypothetical protein
MKLARPIIYVGIITIIVATAVKLIGGGPLAVGIVTLAIPAITALFAAVALTSPWISNHTHFGEQTPSE